MDTPLQVFVIYVVGFMISAVVFTEVDAKSRRFSENVFVDCVRATWKPLVWPIYYNLLAERWLAGKFQNIRNP